MPQLHRAGARQRARLSFVPVVETLESRLVLSTLPLGSEFQVNTYTSDSQIDSAIAMDTTGNFVVAWSSETQNGGASGVYAQRYTASGEKLGNEFTVSSSSLAQSAPAIAMSATGSFVITWTTRNSGIGEYDVYAQRYDSVGAAQGSSFLVNNYTLGWQTSAVVAMDDSGDFVIAWQSRNQDGSGDGVYARRYTADGVAASNEFRVNSYTMSSQNRPAIAMDADGNFIVAWSSQNQDGNLSGIYAQRYDALGTALDGEFRVNETTLGDQAAAAIAMGDAGNFVVAWAGAPGGINARRYFAGGVAVGSEFQVNSSVANYQSSPAIAMGSTGDFVIAWDNNFQDGSSTGIFARSFTAAGSANGNEFQVNSFTTNGQSHAAIAMGDTGSLVISWTSNGQDGGGTIDGGNGGSIQAQRFAAPQGITASITGPQIAVRGAPSAFVVTATGSTGDPSELFDFAIDWDGDGAVDETVQAQSGSTLYHAFAGMGARQVRVTATSALGVSSPEATHDLEVVRWALLPDPQDASKTDLYWGGTEGSDAYAFVARFVIIQMEDDRFMIQPEVVQTGSFNGKLYVYGLGGADLLLADVLAQAVEFHGGDGDDVLVGGRNADYLVGGAGNDMLFGGTLDSDGNDTILGGDGDDFIVGHLGADLLLGEAGGDLIIAGRLSDIRLSLFAYTIQSEWLSGRPYTQRIANTLGTGSANIHMPMLPGSNVFDDSSVDEVLGGSGQDWIVADLATDLILDLAPEEWLLNP